VSENLDLVRSIYAAVGHGDFESADWADPEIEYVRADGFEPDTLLGRDGLFAAMRSLFGALEGFRIQAEDYRELDAERVLVLTNASARGKASGLALDQKGAEVFEIQGGKVTRIVTYFDRANALADLGLEG
jgi:ketosteroid isomerase-like protein